MRGDSARVQIQVRGEHQRSRLARIRAMPDQQVDHGRIAGFAGHAGGAPDKPEGANEDQRVGKVTRLALQNAASVAGLLLTTDS
jgi:hypothetical protein